MAEHEPIDLDAIHRVTDEASSSAAYDRILNTIGHNHSGTLYAEAENAVEPLVQIAVREPGWPANTALEVLLDILGSFDPLQVATPEHAVPPAGMRMRMRSDAARWLPELARAAGRVDEYRTSVRAAQLIEELSVENE